MQKIIFFILLLLLIHITASYAQNADAGDAQVTCRDNTQLAGNTPGTGTAYWSVIGGNAIFEDCTNPTTLVSGLYAGINTLRWTFVDNGSTDDVVITNNIFFADAGYDQVIDDYDNNSTYLEAILPSGTTGEWSIIGGAGVFTDNSDAETEVTNIQIDLNTYLWTLYNPNTTCTATDEINIINNILNCNAGDNQIICGDTTTLHGSAVNGSTTWWTSADCEFEDANDPNTQIYNIINGVNTITWHVAINGFKTTCDVEIINYSFNTHAGNDQDICHDYTQLDATAFFGDYFPCLDSNWTGTWSIISGSGTFENINNAKTNITDISENLNELLWTVIRNDYSEAGGVGNCVATDTVSVEIHDLPIVDFEVTPQSQIYPQATIYIENNCNENFVEYAWTYGNGDTQIDTNFIYFHEYNYFDDGWGTYTITLTVQNTNCIAKDSVEIVITAPYPMPYWYSYKACESETFNLNGNVLYTTEGVSEYRWTIYDDANESQESIITQYTEKNPVWNINDPGIYFAVLEVTSEGSGWFIILPNFRTGS